ncbi:MAG: helicase-exonuclease AddAB subunit AddB [Lachnospiraceae bacterium]|nr:helicase-exonuclease AddAB subunit AddB [Lachnospiraceae bacterium]
MGIQFILGKAGGGKTWYIEHEVVREAAAHPDKRYFVVVPEQFTMQTQKNLVELNEHKGLWNIEVQSFLRLAFRIFGETGQGNTPVIDDLGKVMILKKVLLDQKEKLTYFQKNIGKKGYIAEIKSFLSEMMQYGIERETLQEMIEDAKGHVVLQQKLQDMDVAYEAFRDYLKDHYITTEEVLSVFADTAEQSKLLKDCVIYLDGFTGFTPVQYELLRSLMRVCEQVVVTVTMDERETIWHVGAAYKLFYMSQKTIYHIRKIAEEERVPVCPEIWTGKGVPDRFEQAKDLGLLEQNLFRYPFQSYEEKPENISLHCLRQPENEVHFLMQELLQLRKDPAFHYKDVAVVTGNMEVYGTLIRSAMDQAEIPCFIDQKKNIITNAFVGTLYNVLDILRKNFDYESIMKFIKGGFVRFDKESEESWDQQEAVDLLDNFLLASGVRGLRKWQEEWDLGYLLRGKPEELTEQAQKAVNHVRRQIVDKLSGLYEKTARGKHRVREYAEAFCDFLEQEQYYMQIQEYIETFEEQGEKNLAREYRQIYEIVLQVLDRLVELLGEEEIDLAEFREIFDTGMNEARVGLIPPGVDQVVVGDLSRTRLHNVKYLFFLGLNDGNIPSGNGNGGILSDSEREWLSEAEYELAPTARQQIYTEQFYLYLCLTKPSGHLYLCYCEAGNDGKATQPSYVVDRLQKIFPQLQVEVSDEQDADRILGDDLGEKYLIRGLRRGKLRDDAWAELYRQYRLSDKGKSGFVDKLVDAALYINPQRSLSREAAKQLYHDILTGSTSQFERFAACPFAYFAQYGLKLQERQENQVELFDIGNIIHEALEKYTKQLLEQGVGWAQISEQQQHVLANQCLNGTIEEYKNGLLYMTERDTGLIERLRRILLRSVWAITEQMKCGQFETVESEVAFRLMDGNKQLIGRVDRIDVMEDETHRYVRVIDYKTGPKEVSLSDLYHGLQMQLQIYLKAAMSEEKKKTAKEIVPAGVLYYHIHDPLLREKVEGQEWSKKMLEQLRMSGLINETDPILPSMDQALEGPEGSIAANIKSKVIPVSTTSTGKVTKYSGTMTTHQMELLETFTEDKLSEIADRIKEGEIAAKPYKRMDSAATTACDYCKYHSVCGFDPTLKGNTYRHLEKMTNDMVFEEIEKMQKQKAEGEDK